MLRFPENRCRLCSKNFCCEKCRFKHEKNFHNKNPDCEICIYGRTTIKEASVSLLSHIKTNHLPLHCVFCKKIFYYLDDLVPHDKCLLNTEYFKMQEIPKSPLTPTPPISEKDEQSLEITPFYKCINVSKNGTQQLVPLLTSTIVTSTPLCQKDENDSDKITPNNQIQVSIYKSNLKLTGSTNLSDVKKNERRVTFLETPYISEQSKKQKCLTNSYNKGDEGEDAESDFTDESYKSVGEAVIKAVPQSKSEVKENMDNEDIIFDENTLNSTLWESALTKLDIPNISETNSHFNVSLQINVFNKSTKTDNRELSDSEECAYNNNNKSIWSSMSNIVKSVVNNISMTAQTTVGIKRSQPDDAHDVPCLKRMKLTDLKCRRPIRDISPLYHIRLSKPRYIDKATQTEKSWF